MKKKSVALLLALGVMFGSALGGSLAWLHDESTTVTNTFAPSNINITLEESKLLPNGTLDKNEKVTKNENYKMVPGTILNKDPRVTVKANSEACWLFVEVEEVGVSGTVNGKNINYDFDAFLTYDIDDTCWKKLDITSENSVYVYIGSTDLQSPRGDNDYIVPILKNDQISVNGTVTKEMMDDLEKLGKKPELKFIAYASQYKNGTSNFTDVQAWNNISN